MQALLPLAAALLLVGSHAAKLPAYFAPRCSRSSSVAELSACVMERANKGIPTLANGDRKLRIPSMKPLIVPKLSLAQGTEQIGLNLTWQPAEVWGLEGCQLYNVKMDFEKKTTVFDVVVPTFTLAGHYKSTGRILLLPITGEGPSNFTVKNLRARQQYDWPLKKGADGKYYCTVVNSSMKILGADDMKIKFEGLFNGDRLLGNQMNIFLNENWRDLVKELGPGLAEAVGEVLKLVALGIAEHVPVDEMFGP